MEKKQKELLTKIKSDQIKMKPKVYFVLGSVLLALGLITLLLAAAFLVNVGLHHLLVARIISLQIFVLAIAMIGGGFLVLCHYDFAHKRGLGWILLALVTITLVTGIYISHTQFNERAKRIRHLKILYHQKSGIRLPPKGVVKGRILIRPKIN